jgi:hypothetical protein
MNTKFKRFELVLLGCTLLATTITGCGPKNRADCMFEAAKAPTKEGVEYAIYACGSKFNKPIEPNKFDQILNNSEKCNVSKLEEMAAWIVVNKDRPKDDSEFKIIGDAYLKMTEVCKVLGKIDTGK